MKCHDNGHMDRIDFHEHIKTLSEANQKKAHKDMVLRCRPQALGHLEFAMDWFIDGGMLPRMIVCFLLFGLIFGIWMKKLSNLPTLHPRKVVSANQTDPCRNPDGQSRTIRAARMSRMGYSPKISTPE